VTIKEQLRKLHPLYKGTDKELRRQAKLTLGLFLLYWYVGLFLLVVSVITSYTLYFIASALYLYLALLMSNINDATLIKLEIRQINKR